MKDIVELFERLTAEKVLSCQDMANGISNRNYLINGKKVLRVKGAFSDPFYSSSTEHEVESKIAHLDLAPRLLVFDEPSGTKIAEFIEEKVSFVDPHPTEYQLEQVALILKKLHTSGIRVTNKFSMFDRLEAYKKESFARINPIVESSIIAAAKQHFDTKHLVLCHNDVVRGNILFAGDKVYLIDYEYACMNDPVFDLVSFLSENNIEDRKSVFYFLSKYYGNEAMIPVEKISAFYHFLDLLWFYWAGMMQRHCPNPIFAKIADIKHQRLIKL